MRNPNSKEPQGQSALSLDLSPEQAIGTYSNIVVISHSISEFVLDFSRIMPGLETPKVVSRIIMTPDHAKRLLKALNENISRYEDQNGEIVLREHEAASAPLPFTGGIPPEA